MRRSLHGKRFSTARGLMAEVVVTDEMRRAVRAEQCRFGHSFDHIVTGAGELLRVLCANCGKSWNVK